MPKLIDLDPSFVRYESRVETWEVVDGDPDTWRERGCPCKPFTGPREYMVKISSLELAQGLWFQCPICPNGHCVEATFAGRGVPDALGTHNREGKPSRWSVSGTAMENLTLVPSIALQGGCGWHGFVTAGVVA